VFSARMAASARWYLSRYGLAAQVRRVPPGDVADVAQWRRVWRVLGTLSLAGTKEKQNKEHRSFLQVQLPHPLDVAPIQESQVPESQSRFLTGEACSTDSPSECGTAAVRVTVLPTIETGVGTSQ
jgi:hypothetical protein